MPSHLDALAKEIGEEWNWWELKKVSAMLVPGVTPPSGMSRPEWATWLCNQVANTPNEDTLVWIHQNLFELDQSDFE